MSTVVAPVTVKGLARPRLPRFAPALAAVIAIAVGDGVDRRGLDLGQAIDRGRAHEMDARGVLAKPQETRGARRACREVDVRELRDGVADRLVGDAFRAVAAMHVRHADPGDGRRVAGEPGGQLVRAVSCTDHAGRANVSIYHDAARTAAR